MTVTTPHTHHAVDPRLDLSVVAPDAYKAALGVEQHVRRTVDHTLLHLVTLRASMMNGWAYCVGLHNRDAAADGESTQRLFAVAAWHESSFFSVRERAVLALTDSVTERPDGGVPDSVLNEAARHFDDAELANLIVA